MKKLLVMIIMISLLSFSAPQKTKAQYVDIPNFTKEYALDSVAYAVAQTMMRKLTAKTVNWINSGFKGNPGYVSNPRQFFLDVGDDLASQFLSQAGVNQLCSPFQARVRLALVKNYIDDNRNYSCTLSILRNNYDAFTRDFTQGGWEGWFEITQNQQNNPYGAYLSAKNQLSLEVNAARQTQQKEIDLSGGFLNFKRCPRGQTAVDPVSLRTICMVDEETVTPGKVVSEQLQDALGSKWGQLVSADEFNEIITALVGQLIEQVAGGARDGLRGASERGTTPNNMNSSLVDQVANEVQPITNYGPISATQPSLNCRSSGGSGGSGGDGSGAGGGGGSGGTASCTSTPGSISGLPPWPLGGGGSGHGSCPAYTPDPSQDCTRVRAGDVLAILNGFPPSNNGMRAAEGALQAAGYNVTLLQHPVRLDKFDFGNGMVVDVIIGAIGNANGSEDDEGQGWTFNVECACNRDPSGSPATNPPTPLPGTNTYNVAVDVIGLGAVTDGIDSCQSLSVTASTTCTKAYPRDSYQSLTAIPAIGQTFVGWGGACSVFGNNPTCYGYVTGNGAVSATFR